MLRYDRVEEPPGCWLWIIHVIRVPQQVPVSLLPPQLILDDAVLQMLPAALVLLQRLSGLLDLVFPNGLLHSLLWIVLLWSAALHALLTHAAGWCSLLQLLLCSQVFWLRSHSFTVVAHLRQLVRCRLVCKGIIAPVLASEAAPGEWVLRLALCPVCHISSLMLCCS